MEKMFLLTNWYDFIFDHSMIFFFSVVFIIFIIYKSRRNYSGQIHPQTESREQETVQAESLEPICYHLKLIREKITLDYMHRLSPSKIGFSQDTIARTFSQQGCLGGVEIGQTQDDLILRRIQIEDIPPITVCRYNERWISLDNRRLWVLKKYEEATMGNLLVSVIVTPSMGERNFTSTNNGMTVDVRGDPGGTYWKMFLAPLFTFLVQKFGR